MSFKSVDQGLKDLSQERIEPFHYERTIANVSEKVFTGKLHPKRAGKLAVFSGSFVMIIIALLLIPASYSVSIGNIVTAEFPLPEQVLPETIIETVSMLEGVKNKNIQISGNSMKMVMVVRDQSPGLARRTIKKSLSFAIKNSDVITIRSDEIEARIDGNLISVFTDNVMNSGESKMSRQEIDAKITADLISRGVQTNYLKFEKNRSQVKEYSDLDIEIKIRNILESKGIRVERLDFTRECLDGNFNSVRVKVNTKQPDGENTSVNLNCKPIVVSSYNPAF